MTDNVETTAPKPEADRSKSSYRSTPRSQGMAQEPHSCRTVLGAAQDRQRHLLPGQDAVGLEGSRCPVVARRPEPLLALLAVVLRRGCSGPKMSA
jgi:hypothetical protein